MKRAFGLALLLVACAVAAPAAEPDGFGDLRWGDAAPKRWQRKHDGRQWVHTARGRGSAFGTVPLERVSYEFDQGALVRVVLLFREHAAFLTLTRELDSAFGKAGEPTVSKPASESLCWRGSTTWAHLNYLGEGVPGVLFLTRAPQAAGQEELARVTREQGLLNRLRLYEHLDTVLSQSLQVIDGEIGWVERSLEESQPTSVKCRDLQVDREQDQQREQRNRRDLLSSQDSAAAERARLGQEAAAVRAELEALQKR